MQLEWSGVRGAYYFPPSTSGMMSPNMSVVSLFATRSCCGAVVFLTWAMAWVYRFKSWAAISRKMALALFGKARHDDAILWQH